MYEICIPVDICTWNISLFWDVAICTNMKDDRRYVQIFYLDARSFIFSERNVYTFNKRCCKIESVFKHDETGEWESFNCSPLQHVPLVTRKCLLNDNHKSAFCFPYIFRKLQNLLAFYERHPCYRTFYVNVFMCKATLL